MQSLTILSWNTETLGQSTSLPSLIARLATNHQTDLMILLDPRPAAGQGSGVSGAIKAAFRPSGQVAREICAALNSLEELPGSDGARPFKWRHVQCDPSFRPEDLPKALITTVTTGPRGEVRMETGISKSGATPAGNSRRSTVKTANWNAEVTRLRSLLGKPNWRPLIPSPGTALSRLIKLPGSTPSAQKTEAAFDTFYEKKCQTRQAKDPGGNLLYQQTIFSYRLKTGNFGNTDSKTLNALEAVRKVLTDLGVLKANADSYHVLFRAGEPVGEGLHQRYRLVSLSLPEGPSGFANRAYHPLPVLISDRIHLRWPGLDGGIPGAAPASTPANGRAPGLLNSWWKDRYLPVFLSHMPLSSLRYRQSLAGFDDLSSLELVPPDGSPVSLAQATDALLWLNTGSSGSGGEAGKVLQAFAKKGKLKNLLSATSQAADSLKTALIDREAFLADPAAFDHSLAFRADAFDQLLFKTQGGITPVPSRVLDLVELFFWGCLYRLQERKEQGRLKAEALPLLFSFAGEQSEEVASKGALLPVDLFCLLGKTPGPDMTPQALLGDAFLACRSLVGAHLPVLTAFNIH